MLGVVAPSSGSRRRRGVLRVLGGGVRWGGLGDRAAGADRPRALDAAPPAHPRAGRDPDRAYLWPLPGARRAPGDGRGAAAGIAGEPVRAAAVRPHPAAAHRWTAGA